MALSSHLSIELSDVKLAFSGRLSAKGKGKETKEEERERGRESGRVGKIRNDRTIRAAVVRLIRIRRVHIYRRCVWQEAADVLALL